MRTVAAAVVGFLAGLVAGLFVGAGRPPDSYPPMAHVAPTERTAHE